MLERILNDRIRSYELLTSKNFRMKNKLKLYIYSTYTNKYCYTFVGDSFKELECQVSEIFNNDIYLKSNWDDIRLNIIDTNKTQLKLF